MPTGAPLPPGLALPKAYAVALEYFKPEARELIANNPLEILLLGKPDVHRWLESQSRVAPKQSYVNTSTALSFMVELWQQAPSVGILYVVGQAVYTQLASKSEGFQASLTAKKCAWPKGLSYADCLNKAFEEAHKSLNRALGAIKDAYNQSTVPHPEHWMAIHKDLARAYETLLSIAWLALEPMDLQLLTINTERVPGIPQLGQSALRWLCYPIERLCGLPAPRPYKDRCLRASVSYMGCQKILKQWIYLTAADNAHTEIALFNQYTTSADDIWMLWKRLRQVQGARLENDAHAYYLWADRTSPKPAFQLYDPWTGKVHNADGAYLAQKFKKRAWAAFFGERTQE